MPSEYEAAVGIATVPDERLDRLAAMSASKNVVAAGLRARAPGAAARARSPGEGLGAKVLGAVRNCDAILVVLRAFDDGGVAADPAGDLDALELEFVMADLDSVEQRLNRQRRAAKSGDKEIAAEVARARTRPRRALRRHAAGARPRAGDLERLAPVFCLTTKPTLVVLNTGEKVDDDAAARIPGAIAVPIEIEAEIAACAPEDRAEMREMYGVGESALDTVAHAAYHLLGRRTFLTTGEDESRAWTFRAGAKAPECAGVIHSDLQRGFIRAEVIDWQRAARDRFVVEGREAGRSCASRARTTKCATATCSRSASTSSRARNERDALARAR